MLAIDGGSGSRPAATQGTVGAGRSFTSTPSRRERSSSTTTTTGSAGTSRTRSIRTSLPTPPNANSAKTGARAGDNALFSFKLYSDLKLTRPVGNAIYSCTFNFAQEAICEANFTLNGGTMIAMGPAKLDGSTIVLPVTGGTGRYAGAHGQLTSRSSGTKNTQIIRFRLV